MVTTERDYKKQSYAFLQQAQEELEKNDLLQASEKGWGAAAQMVKAVAVLRGLNHQTHRHLFEIVGSLENERADSGFAAANTLHINFYEGWLDQRQVREYLTAVGSFVRTLDEISQSS